VRLARRAPDLHRTPRSADGSRRKFRAEVKASGPRGTSAQQTHCRRAGNGEHRSRPGGNVTGISFMSVELAAKQLGLLRELRPGMRGRSRRGRSSLTGRV
jgi:hypothetical protein